MGKSTISTGPFSIANCKRLPGRVQEKQMISSLSQGPSREMYPKISQVFSIENFSHITQATGDLGTQPIFIVDP